MHLSQLFGALAGLSALAMSSPTAMDTRDFESDTLASRQLPVCNGAVNSCFINGCAGTFATPWDLIGVCSSGTYKGCLCKKCGKDGSCTANGCNGNPSKICQGGTYQGCSCK